MRAIIYTKYGPPDVLQVKEVDKPKANAKEVLVKVFATTVNRTDCADLRAKPFIMRFVTGLLKPKKIIQGTDFAGEIVDIGNEVRKFKVGDKVFGFDDMVLSSHAQYMTLSEDKAIEIMPGNVTYEQAAASIEGAHYAYNIINKVDIKSGQRILVNGATGAIGSAVVQLLKYYGAHITAVCNGEYSELVKSIGADKIIDYTKEDFTKSEEKYVYIFDAVGKSTFSNCKPLLESGGVYISSELGTMAQNIFYALFTPFFGKKKVIFPFPTDLLRSVRLIKKLSEEGNFKAVIDRKYPLDEIAEAYSYVEKGEKIGNVVINIKHT